MERKGNSYTHTHKKYICIEKLTKTTRKLKKIKYNSNERIFNAFLFQIIIQY